MKKIKADPHFVRFIEPMVREKFEKVKDDPQELNKANVDVYNLHDANVRMKKSFRKGVFR